MRWKIHLGLILLVGVGLGCPRKGSIEIDAGLPPPAPPPTVRVELRVEVEDGGQLEVPLVPGANGRIMLDPAQKLHLSITPVLKAYRVRLFDELDRAMVSNDIGDEIPDAGIQYMIDLEKPLKTGHRYSLVIDSGTQPLTDEFGRTYPEQRFELQVLGERQRSEPEKKRRR